MSLLLITVFFLGSAVVQAEDYYSSPDSTSYFSSTVAMPGADDMEPSSELNSADATIPSDYGYEYGYDNGDLADPSLGDMGPVPELNPGDPAMIGPFWDGEGEVLADEQDDCACAPMEFIGMMYEWAI